VRIAGGAEIIDMITDGCEIAPGAMVERSARPRCAPILGDHPQIGASHRFYG
jgi:hypothetical protein